MMDQSKLDLGEKVYISKCKVCHGEKGNVNQFAASVLTPPPRNFISKTSKRELTKVRMIQSVKEGRPGTAMMPWKDILTPIEIISVINYIRKVLMEVNSD